MKRYNLVLPEELYFEVEKIANKEKISVVEILRRFIKLGLVATKIQDDPDSHLIFRKGDVDQEFLIL